MRKGHTNKNRHFFMKTINSLSLLCAFLGAATPLGVAQIARAQEQPRPPQSAIDFDAKIALPAQFSATEFFETLARATGTRVVAPLPGDAQLIQLNQRFGGRELTFSQFAQLYEATLNYSLSKSRGDANLTQVRLPDEMIYPVRPIRESSAPFLRLLVALSPAQIERMYLQNGLTAQDLTSAQIPLYLEVRRTNAISNFLKIGEKPPSDAEILAQPLRFSFAFQAVALFTDDESLPSLSLFDYGKGLIWDPLVSTDTKAFAKAAYERSAARLTPVGQIDTSSISSEKARATTLDYPQTRATNVGAALDALEAELGQTVVFDGTLFPRRVRAVPIIISAGRYHADEMLDALAASVGAQSRFYNDVPTLEKRPPQQPMSQMPPLVEQSQQKLQRLSLQSAGLPFFPMRFERPQTLYSELWGSEILYLHAKLLNENTKGYDEIDLSKHTFRFANEFYFIGRSGGPNSPFVTSSLQLW